MLAGQTGQLGNWTNRQLGPVWELQSRGGQEGSKQEGRLEGCRPELTRCQGRDPVRVFSDMLHATYSTT